jgi:DNA-binding NarL/FixJ family response regulator
VGDHYLIVDDNQGFCRALRSALRSYGDSTLAHNLRDARAAIRAHSYKALFVDVRLVDGSGFEVLSTFRLAYPDTPAMVITGYFEQDGAGAAQRLGALYVCKPVAPDDIVAFVGLASLPRPNAALPRETDEFSNQLHLDSTHLQSLTRRERQVYCLLAQGLHNWVIAQRLCVSAETVRSHVKQIFSKLGIPSQRALMLSARQLP